MNVLKEKLVSIEQCGLLDSREVAEMVETTHCKILRKLEGDSTRIGVIQVLTEARLVVANYFIKSIYKDKSGKKNKCYLFTLNGVKIMLDRMEKSSKTKLLMNWYVSQIKTNSEIIILLTRFEESFMTQLEQTLDAMEYKLIKQKPVLDGKYRLDGYIEKLKLAIEYDEGQHDDLNNQILDKQRQSEIEQELDCQFVRCSYKNTDAYNVGLVVNKIINIQLN